MWLRVSAVAVVSVLWLTRTGLEAQNYANLRTFLEDSQEFKIAYPIVQRLSTSDRVARFNWTIIETPEDAEHLARPVWVLASVIRALQREPGRLAFVIAHDIAKHAPPAKIDNRDVLCTDKPTEAIAASGDPRTYVIKTRAECESLADPIAVRYMASAGYNPLDASAFLSSVIGASQDASGRPFLLRPRWVREYVAMHPTNTQRLDRLRIFVNDFCAQNAARCSGSIDKLQR